MSAAPLAAILGYGFVLGIRHSFDPDHLVAMATIVGESRSIRRSALVGSFWGLGHTASLLVAGVILLAFRVAIPERVGLGLELGVAAMLVFLGGVLLARSA